MEYTFKNDIKKYESLLSTFEKKSNLALVTTPKIMSKLNKNSQN